jgi:hypothetical protein
MCFKLGIDKEHTICQGVIDAQSQQLDRLKTNVTGWDEETNRCVPGLQSYLGLATRTFDLTEGKSIRQVHPRLEAYLQEFVGVHRRDSE